MSRRKPELQALDLASWPTVAWTDYEARARKVFSNRIQAIERFARGDAIGDIERSAGVNRRQIYRWLERALAPHPDGRIFGFRGLQSYVRVKEYARLGQIAVRGERGSRGLAGAFSQLLERHTALSAWLRLQVKRRRVVLVQIHTEGRLHTRLRGLKPLHAEFLCRCRDAGITVADYPFNTDGRGIRSLAAHLKAEMLHTFATAARSAGASHLKGLPYHGEEARSPAATRPYQVVEFDGHRLDIRLKVVVLDQLGVEQAFEIERVWLLAIIDVCTRAVLGYHIALGREYSRYDVIKTIENALEPHRARCFTIPGLAYGPRDGFPSQRLAELAYVTWEWMKLDNAKANLANESRAALCEFVGCCVDAGPTYSPDERPYIERFFGTIASRLSSRLPGYTGSHTRDLRRALADPKGNLRLYVSLDELDELIEFAIASYHGTPHAGLNNVTPLEAMEYFVRGRQQLLMWLPEHHRRTLCLMQSAMRCPVRAYLEKGVRPHINLYGARYTSDTLACSTHLIGRRLLVYVNADDLRSVRAFLPDGAELGVLDAQGAWRVVPHNLKLRQQILKEKGNRRSDTAGYANPIEEYVHDKLTKAKKARRAASELAQAKRMLSAAPTARTPVGPAKAAMVATTVSNRSPEAKPEREPVVRTPTRPRRLTIGNGQVF
ncbi:integrase [Burkholderia sp. Ac-20365]|jgi:transposase InsO family protein|uniref:integrase n=1 Tax=Burkholderia sp. Ac-20365 TaxID=2703897 RepID=UPI00197C3825|nr:integrase [Burkholderia sp. Ac-20365]MBN3760760.1 transposase family protein [Burkholderia sp. Ac-20365]